MKPTSIIIAASAALLFAVACKKDIADFDNTYPGSTASTGALGTALQQNGPQTLTVTFNAAAGTSFMGYAGTKVFIPANAFVYPNQQPVTGNVTVTMIEAYNKKDIICTGGFTTSNGLPLVSGGEIFIQATQGNAVLEYNSAAAPMRVLFPVNNPTTEMELFVAQDIRQGVDFNMVDSSLFISTDCTYVPGPPGPPPPPPPYYYEIYYMDLGWINCDYFYNYAGEKTEVIISVPPMFDESNSTVICVLQDYNSVSNTHMYTTASHAFEISHGYKIPVGTHVRFYCFAEINGQLYWGESTTQEITAAHVTSVIPQPVTRAEFDQKMQSLE